jgi:hypothetical protein
MRYAVYIIACVVLTQLLAELARLEFDRDVPVYMVEP